MSTFLGFFPLPAAQGMIWGIMAIGVYLTFRILDVADLTVDGSFATGGAVCVMLIRAGVSAWIALPVAFAAGAVAGTVTGLLHTRCGIPVILAGILTQLALYSVNLRIMSDKANQPVSVDRFSLLVSSRYVGETSFRNPLLILLVLLALTVGALYWFFGTELGASVRATGANRKMARAQGIITRFNTVLGLALSNGLVALSGALMSQFQGFANVDMGKGAIVIGLAAVIIGEVLFSRVFRNFALRLCAVIIGSILYYLILQLILLAGLRTNDLKLFTAVTVAIFLAVPYWNRHLRGRFGRKKVTGGDINA
ncbi:MAG: ABC transporter permease [Eubacteriales bacterium]|nr:ABC transporter permease [Eubacteriales bacterium]